MERAPTNSPPRSLPLLWTSGFLPRCATFAITSESVWTHSYELKSAVNIRFTLSCGSGSVYQPDTQCHVSTMTVPQRAWPPPWASRAPPFHPARLNSWQPLVFFFLIYIFYWSIVDWPCFRCTAEWFSYAYTHILFLKLFSIIDYYKILSFPVIYIKHLVLIAFIFLFRNLAFYLY